jgi:hypothetical protein
VEYNKSIKLVKHDGGGVAVSKYIKDVEYLYGKRGCNKMKQSKIKQNKQRVLSDGDKL